MHRFTTRKVSAVATASLATATSTGTVRSIASTIVVPWEQEAVEKGGFPAYDDPVWEKVGEALVEKAQTFDLGPVALEECGDARAQLETVVQGCGYSNYEVFTFGGMAVMDIMEVGGDVDFCAVGDVEPKIDEASEIVSRLGREMRRLGLRCFPHPKARVPVVKADRTSWALPGTPLNANATTAVFQAVQEFTPQQQQDFMLRILSTDWQGVECHWMGPQVCHVKFSSTNALFKAVSQITEHEGILIPLRIPVDPKDGPELYRYPFDLTLNTTGLRNSSLFHEAMSHYNYSRHLLLCTKRWAKGCDVVNTSKGLLPSYANQVLLLHYLVAVGAIPKLDLRTVSLEPMSLSKYPTYHALDGVDGARSTEESPEQQMQTLGYLYGHFFQYFATQFDYAEKVVCTTVMNLPKEAIPMWSVNRRQIKGDILDKPPFYHFAIKDPYNTHNIARNLDATSVRYVQSAFGVARDLIAAHTKNDATAAVAGGSSSSSGSIKKTKKKSGTAELVDILTAKYTPEPQGVAKSAWHASGGGAKQQQMQTGAYGGGKLGSRGMGDAKQGGGFNKGSHGPKMAPGDFLRHAQGDDGSSSSSSSSSSQSSSVQPPGSSNAGHHSTSAAEEELKRGTIMDLGTARAQARMARLDGFGDETKSHGANLKSAQELTSQVLNWLVSSSEGGNNK